jgi:hypothetical protein
MGSPERNQKKLAELRGAHDLLLYEIRTTPGPGHPPYI